MNKHLLYSAILVAAVSANEAKAQDKVTAPDAPVPVQLNLDGKDTVYVYNVKAKMWLNQGNDWGTQANLLEKGGLKLAFVPNKTNGVPMVLFLSMAIVLVNGRISGSGNVCITTEKMTMVVQFM